MAVKERMSNSQMKTTIVTKTAVKLVGAVAMLVLAALWTAAFAAAPEPIRVHVSESYVLPVEGVTKAGIADPAIADVVPIIGREIIINGKKAGVTSLTIWRDAQPPQIYRVEVTANVAPIQESIRAATGYENVVVRAVGDTILLEGNVENELQLARTLAVATAYRDKVVNLLEVTAPRQVRIRTRFVEVSVDALKNIGIRYFTETDGAVRYGFSRVAEFEPGSSALGLHQFLTPAGGNFEGVDATLQLLVQKDYARILSEPTLVTLSGKEASFLAGGEVPIVQRLTATETFSVIFKEFGVRMNIKSVVDSSYNINTHILTEVSRVNPDLTVAGVPSFLTRRTETDVQVKDGQTIVIGGLLDNNVERDAIRKLPWLGDVPVLGNLFRSKQFRQKQSELLVFVTPEVVKDIDAMTTTAPQTQLMQEWHGGRATEKLLQRPNDGKGPSGAQRTLMQPKALENPPKAVKKAGAEAAPAPAAAVEEAPEAAPAKPTHEEAAEPEAQAVEEPAPAPAAAPAPAPAPAKEEAAAPAPAPKEKVKQEEPRRPTQNFGPRRRTD
jgi:pilus assembly protein CpaC